MLRDFSYAGKFFSESSESIVAGVKFPRFSFLLSAVKIFDQSPINKIISFLGLADSYYVNTFCCLFLGRKRICISSAKFMESGQIFPWMGHQIFSRESGRISSGQAWFFVSSPPGPTPVLPWPVRA